VLVAMKGNCVYRLWQQKPLMPSHSWLVPYLIKVIMGSWDSLVIACMNEFIMIFFIMCMLYLFANMLQRND